MRFPFILFQTPDGVPPLEICDTRDDVPTLVAAIVLCAILGLVTGFCETTATGVDVLAVLAPTFAIAPLWVLRSRLDDAGRIEEEARNALSAHQRILLERRGGTAALRRGLLLKWFSPVPAVAMVAAGSFTLSTAVRLLIQIHFS